MTEQVYETERLRIRHWTKSDAQRLFEIYSHPAVWEHIPELRVQRLEEAGPRLTHLAATYRRYGPGLGVWAALRKSDELVVGTVMLKNIPDGDQQLTAEIEVGWHLARDCWGQGYATEMAQGALRHGFQQKNLDRIIAVTHAENVGSEAVMKRLGMSHRGLTQAYYGEELVLYELQLEQWRALESARAD